MYDVLEFRNASGAADFTHVIFEVSFLGSMFFTFFGGGRGGGQVPHQPVILVILLLYQYIFSYFIIRPIQWYLHLAGSI